MSLAEEVMRYALVLILAALVMLPGVGSIAQAAQDDTVGTHATRGVVTSIDADTLVISRSGKQGAMTFEFSAATARDGEITVGAPVSIRYREEGSKHIATAVTVQQPKNSPPRKSS
jgi:hypothetical protein